jgi:hypothetical protein
VHRAPSAPTRVRMEASSGSAGTGRHGGLDKQTFSWKLRAIMPAPAQTYASLAAFQEGDARAAPRALPARRVHGVERQGPRCISPLQL